MPSAFLCSSALLLTCLVGIVARPGKLPVAVFPILGALLVLLFGLEPFSALPMIWSLVWDATLTLIGLMIISLALDQFGFFRWCALGLARLSRGNPQKAWWGFMVLAWVTTAVLANDGAMLILVPIYAEMLLVAGLSHREIFAFLFPVGFLIDVASTPFITSNLTNIMVADYFKLSFWEYARLMAVPSLVLGVTSLAVLWFAYRSHLPQTLVLGTEDAPPNSLMKVAGIGTLLALALGFSLSHYFRWPVSVVVGTVAIGLLILGGISKNCRFKEILFKAPWSVALFALSLFVLVDALARSGGAPLLNAFWGGTSSSMRSFAVGGSIGILAATLNNLPALLLGLLGFGQAHNAVSAGMIAASVIGANVAPKFTPYGSLATLLWMGLLAQKGLRMRWRDYMKASLLLTPPVFVAGLLSVWLCCR